MGSDQSPNQETKDSQKELQYPPPAYGQEKQNSKLYPTELSTDHKMHQKLVQLQPTPGMNVNGPMSQKVICPYCQQETVTITERMVGARSYLASAMICGFSLCFPPAVCCVWVPLTVDSFKDTAHRCSRCRRMLVRNKLFY
ncbi:LITAF-like zinc ribbon domain-containing protein [Globomyces pollinis-pini]|nr:LITAF-like zinc ribbon domain-containing protein [Globomyces pollinis-pini]